MTDVSPSGHALRPIALFAELSDSELENVARHRILSITISPEQVTGHGDLGHLKRGVTAMANDLGSDLDRFLAPLGS